MNATQATKWVGEHGIVTTASADVIWRLWTDVDGWKRWNAGVKQARLKGPFAPGTEFEMTLPDGDVVTSYLREVRCNEGFDDETTAGDLVVRVRHTIERCADGRCRILYSLEASGPEAADMGPAISSDFPQVLKALAALAEGQIGR